MVGRGNSVGTVIVRGLGVVGRSRKVGTVEWGSRKIAEGREAETNWTSISVLKGLPYRRRPSPLRSLLQVLSSARDNEEW